MSAGLETADANTIRCLLASASLTVSCVLTTVLVAAFALTGPLWLVTCLLGTVLAVQLARSTVAQGSATRVALPTERMT